MIQFLLTLYLFQDRVFLLFLKTLATSAALHAGKVMNSYENM